MNHDQDIFEILKLLSNPQRLDIIHWLLNPKKYFPQSKFDVEKEGVCIGLIVDKLKQPQPTVSMHINNLKRAKLIITVKKSQWILCKINASYVKDFLKDMNELLEYNKDITKK